MRTAIFGGAFDPIHNGHLLIAETARVQFKLDHVIFLPAGRPPHKARLHAPAADRLAMCRAAIRGQPAFHVSSWEILKNRTVYTQEAIAHFRSTRPREQLYFILGTDALRDIPRWKSGTSLLRTCRFLAAERPEAPWLRLPPAVRRRVSLIRSPLIGVASHEIRAQVARGHSIRYQVPPAVERWILKRRLYRGRSR